MRQHPIKLGRPHKMNRFIQKATPKYIDISKYIEIFSPTGDRLPFTNRLGRVFYYKREIFLKLRQWVVQPYKPLFLSHLRFRRALFRWVVIPVLFWGSLAQAGMGERLEGMFRSMGFQSHATSGGAYSDQKGGYITGGSLFARAPVADNRLLNFQAPSFGWGCGGVDLFTGAISFISKEDLVNTLRAIGSNAMSYAYGLALQQVTPQIKAVIDNLQATMQEINNANINSCRMAAQLVGGLAPKTQASSELYCSSKGLKLGRFTDYADAKHQCQDDRKRTRVDQARDAEFKDTLGEEFNLVWKAIQGNAFLREDQETGEFMMSLSGSIISKKERDTPRMKYLPSLITNPQFMKAIIGAGLAKGDDNTRIKIYRCDEGEMCLNPFEKKDVLVKGTNTLIQRVQKMVLGLYKKVREDKAPTDEEKGFVNATSIPILRILAINAAYKNDAHPISLPELVEIIAYDILLSHITNILNLILERVMDLKAVQISDEAIGDFKESILRTQSMVLGERRTLLHQLQASLAMVERVEKLEKFTYNKFLSAHMKDLHEV